MNNYEKHFEEELAILQSTLTEGDELVIKDFIPLIKQATDIFSKQGHSGSSAPFYANALANAIKDVLLFRPLSPITGDDSEWVCDHMEEGMCQNKRLSSVFKKKGGQAYYLDAIVWSGEEEHDRFTGTVSGISSRQYVKFPFIPKTFYVDVVKIYWNEEGKPPAEVDCHEEDWKEGKRYYQYSIKDHAQLEEVFAYYDKYEQTNR